MGDVVAITGATGLLGRALAAALHERGDEVVALVRDPAGARKSVPGALDYVQYAHGVEGPWADALDEVDCVVNLAGEPLFRPFTGKRYLKKVTQERIDGTRMLAAAMSAAKRPARLMVNASSIGVYGFGRITGEAVDEASTPYPGVYAEGSLEWEAAATGVATGTRVMFLRMGYVLAADGGGLPYQIEQAQKGKASYFAPGDQWLPWIHLVDVVGVILAAFEGPEWSGAYNVVAPEQVRSREFAEALARAVGSEGVRMAPPLIAKVFLGAGADILLKGRRVVPARLVRAGYDFVHSDLDGALRQITSSKVHENDS